MYFNSPAYFPLGCNNACAPLSATRLLDPQVCFGTDLTASKAIRKVDPLNWQLKRVDLPFFIGVFAKSAAPSIPQQSPSVAYKLLII